MCSVLKFSLTCGEGYRFGELCILAPSANWPAGKRAGCFDRHVKGGSCEQQGLFRKCTLDSIGEKLLPENGSTNFGHEVFDV